MDFVLLVSRLQFAMTAFFHFIFVPLTLGLSTISAIMLTLHYATGREIYRDMAKFWAKLFAINFALGVATGLVHEFEFGMNWSVYSRFVGDIFGAPLAIEGLLAFFMESTFMGVFLFGWDKVPKGVHLLAAWLSSIGSNLSALWILVANGWMQHPVGAEVSNFVAGKRAELTDWWSVVFNPVADVKFWHTATAGMVLSAIFVLSVSAYHLLRKQNVEFFKKSAYVALIFGLIASVGEIIIGDIHAHEVAKTQPTKLAAMEALWDTKSGANISLAAWVDQKAQKNAVEIPLPIPGLLSFLATHDFNGKLLGAKDLQKKFEAQFGPGNYIPPVNLVFWAFHIMVYLGFFFVILFIWGLAKYRDLENATGFLKVALYSLPLPYIACWLGWVTAEVGRQPWIVYPLTDDYGKFLLPEIGLKTAHAVSPLTNIEVVITYVIFLLTFTGLAIADFYLLSKFAAKGPEKEAELY
jgi:cytochrome d ubiquinol oxidase subunit I